MQHRSASAEWDRHNANTTGTQHSTVYPSIYWGTVETMLSAKSNFYSSNWFHVGNVVCARYEGTNGTFPFSGK